MPPPPPYETDNVSDWSLAQFQKVYQSEDITKDDVWDYIYGVMHAPDWRREFKNDLQKNLPSIPLAPGGIEAFQKFCKAGAELFDLHADYEQAPLADVKCIVDESVEENLRYRIVKQMRFGKDPETKQEDRSVLHVNDHCRLVDIPPEAHEYQISGRSPLDWAVGSLREKLDKRSGIRDDPNTWHAWADNSVELINHLRRLIHIGIESTRIIRSLPPALPSEPLSEVSTDSRSLFDS